LKVSTLIVFWQTTMASVFSHSIRPLFFNFFDAAAISVQHCTAYYLNIFCSVFIHLLRSMHI